MITSDGTALVGLWFEGQKYFAVGLNTQHCERRDLPLFDETKRWLNSYFCGIIPSFTPPLCMRGSDFRRRVWQVLLTIPYGRTMTYGEIARQVGCRSAQAVGGAVGHNPISIIVPCHRVVGSDGSLTGYSAGLDKKVFLLQLERQSPLLRAAHHKRHQALA